MTKAYIKWAAFLASALLLTACTTEEEPESSAAQSDSEETAGEGIEIMGLAHHYHTGDEVELVASSETAEDAQWQWYTRDSDDQEWSLVSAQTTERFSREATLDGLQIKAVLVDDDEEVLEESEPVVVEIDDHHGHDETTRRIYNGFFYNDEIGDRDLSDWEGDWQSVYPYLQSSDLDEVFEAKAAESDTMDFDDYVEYYDIGYETDVDRIVIEDDSFTFYYQDGNDYTAEYEYDGYEVLNYQRGNRGVRFIFSRVEGSEEMPQYIQFSDHIISPNESDHFHLYWGDDHDELIDEVTNWPTYYPSELDSEGLVQDMLAH